MKAKRLCLLLSCWTLIHLDPVFGSLSRARPTEHQHPQRLGQAAGGREREQSHRRSAGTATSGTWKLSAVSPPKITRIRAGPLPIRGETTRSGAVTRTQQLRDRTLSLALKEAVRPRPLGGDVHVKAPGAAALKPQAASTGTTVKLPGTARGGSQSRKVATKAGIPEQLKAGGAQQGGVPAGLRGPPKQKVPRVTERELPDKQPLVVPHDYMVSLYWSLSSSNQNRSALHEVGLANTVTSFVDRGQGNLSSRDPS